MRYLRLKVLIDENCSMNQLLMLVNLRRLTMYDLCVSQVVQ